MRIHKFAIVASRPRVPAAAFAAQPSHPATPNSKANSNANATSTTGASSANSHAMKVMFVLRGTLSPRTPGSRSTNGSVSITVKSSNHESGLPRARR